MYLMYKKYDVTVPESELKLQGYIKIARLYK